LQVGRLESFTLNILTGLFAVMMTATAIVLVVQGAGEGWTADAQSMQSVQCGDSGRPPLTPLQSAAAGVDEPAARRSQSKQGIVPFSAPAPGVNPRSGRLPQPSSFPLHPTPPHPTPPHPTPPHPGPYPPPPTTQVHPSRAAEDLRTARPPPSRTFW
jgi:hypothetical protein